MKRSHSTSELPGSNVLGGPPGSSEARQPVLVAQRSTASPTGSDFSDDDKTSFLNALGIVMQANQDAEQALFDMIKMARGHDSKPAGMKKDDSAFSRALRPDPDVKKANELRDSRVRSLEDKFLKLVENHLAHPTHRPKGFTNEVLTNAFDEMRTHVKDNDGDNKMKLGEVCEAILPSMQALARNSEQSRTRLNMIELHAKCLQQATLEPIEKFATLWTAQGGAAQVKGTWTGGDVGEEAGGKAKRSKTECKLSIVQRVLKGHYMSNPTRSMRLGQPFPSVGGVPENVQNEVVKLNGLRKSDPHDVVAMQLAADELSRQIAVSCERQNSSVDALKCVSENREPFSLQFINAELDAKRPHPILPTMPPSPMVPMAPGATRVPSVSIGPGTTALDMLTFVAGQGPIVMPAAPRPAIPTMQHPHHIRP